MGYVVKAAALVAKMKNETGEGYLYRGDVVPAAVPASEVDRLADLGLIAEAEVVTVVAAAPVVVEVPDADGTSVPEHLQGLTVSDLQSYAATNDIDLDGAAKKDAIIAAIVKAEAA